MGIKVTWTGTLDQKLASGQAKAAAYLAKTTVYYSMQAETRAKKGAKWTDRTGNARSGLVGSYNVSRSATGGEYAVELSYSVNYGVFLETRRFSKKGNLAIIDPTLKYFSPRFQKAAGDVLQRIFG